MEVLKSLTEKQQRKVPDLRPGDTVRVHTKIIEGSKERIQVYEGVVIRVKGSGNAQTFTVRKISYGIGVERTFLAQSPKLAKIEIRKRSTVRRAYLTYLRDLRGKAAKLKDKRFDMLAVNIAPELKAEDLAPAVEEDIDAEITELDTEEITEISIDDVTKAEEKEAEEVVTSDVDLEGQEAEIEEIAAGVEEAETDLEHGKDGEGAEAEVAVEDVKSE